MRSMLISVVMVLLCGLPALSQSGFDPGAYADYLERNRNLSYGELNALYTPGDYYKDRLYPASASTYEYFDSITASYDITEDELTLLEKNKFMVTERLSFPSMVNAMDHIYNQDLPVFLSTDAVLDALHRSYDLILQHLESQILIPNLEKSLSLMGQGISELEDKYGDNPGLSDALADADLYITVAQSLIDHKTYNPQIASQENINTVLKAIYDEDFARMPLFSERDRLLDFSQFRPRGHYINEWGDDKFEEYFRAMIWLGRIDFFLTPPPVSGEPEWTKEEIRRMHLASFMLQELLETSGASEILMENDRIIAFMVGESDNLTPGEYSDIIDDIPNLAGADQLLSDDVYDPYYQKVSTSLVAGQKILSNMFKSDPFNPEPMELPVSYKLFGQRFVIDSYIFSNVVFDRIIYQGNKIKRMMPDPLDVMFVLGNNNAGELLKEEMETFHYASQVDALRYLVESYDDEFWDLTLYNTWLQALRELNPASQTEDSHYFLSTVAWQQQKLNTQLASWAQLRHDNLLYVKQSYTGIPACSFPHSFVEPYPEFFRRIEDFSKAASDFFSINLEAESYVVSYFKQLGEIMQQLGVIAEKELMLQALTDGEKDFLESMFHQEGSYVGATLDGWFSKLYFEAYGEAIWIRGWESDYVIADVHTQPADWGGNIIGKIMHVGTGKVNLGVFLVDNPSDNGKPTAYIGPFMSYYEHNTLDFDRKTDEWWAGKIESEFPVRPNWTNVYLADSMGNIADGGRELKGNVFITSIENTNVLSDCISVFPNPVHDLLTIQIDSPGTKAIEIYSLNGQMIYSVNSESQNIQIDLSPIITKGVYFITVRSKDSAVTEKIIKL